MNPDAGPNGQDERARKRHAVLERDLANYGYKQNDQAGQQIAK